MDKNRLPLMVVCNIVRRMVVRKIFEVRLEDIISNMHLRSIVL